MRIKEKRFLRAVKSKIILMMKILECMKSLKKRKIKQRISLKALEKGKYKE